MHRFFVLVQATAAVSTSVVHSRRRRPGSEPLWSLLPPPADGRYCRCCCVYFRYCHSGSLRSTPLAAIRVTAQGRHCLQWTQLTAHLSVLHFHLFHNWVHPFACQRLFFFFAVAAAAAAVRPPPSSPASLRFHPSSVVSPRSVWTTYDCDGTHYEETTASSRRSNSNSKPVNASLCLKVHNRQTEKGIVWCLPADRPAYQRRISY